MISYIYIISKFGRKFQQQKNIFKNFLIFVAFLEKVGHNVYINKNKNEGGNKMDDKNRDLYLQLLYSQIEYWKDMAYANKKSLEYYKGIVDTYFYFDIVEDVNNENGYIGIDDVMLDEHDGVDSKATLETYHPEEHLGYMDYTNIEDELFKRGNEDED